MTSYQENTTKLPIKCSILTTDCAKIHGHTDKRRNRFLKHKRVKQSSYRIVITTQTKQAHPDMTSRTTMISEEYLY